MQCTELALPLAAIDNISAHLNWDKENGHLWAIAPQECEKFRTRMQLLHKEKDTEEFRAYMLRAAGNRPDNDGENPNDNNQWRYLLLPILISISLATLASILTLETYNRVSNFLSVLIFSLAVSGGISWRLRFENRVLHHQLIDIHAAQNLLSNYRPIWLRWRAFILERQQRTKEWLDLIESRHSEIAASIDPKTRDFWKGEWPSIPSRERLFFYFLLALPFGFVIASALSKWIIFWDAKSIFISLLWLIIFFFSVASQIYLLAAVPLWLKPLIERIDAWLGKRILTARFQTLPSKGLSCTKMLLSSLAISGFLTIVALAFELNHRNSAWISCGVLAPIAFLVCCWVYLTRFERFSNERKTEFLVTEKFGYQFQWWHLIIIFTALRTIGKAVS